MRVFLCVGFVWISSFWTCAQNFNRPVPEDHVPYQFQQLDTTFDGYYFMAAFFFSGANPEFYMSMLDADGYVAWWSDAQSPLVDFRYVPEHDRYTFYKRFSATNIRFYEMDASFNLTDSVVAVNGPDEDGHEFLTLDNGNRLIITQEDTVMDLSAYTFNGTPGGLNSVVKANGIQEFDPSGNLVFSWKSTDHIHPSEFISGYSYDSSSFDYCHANSIDQDTDGNLLFSCRHLDAVYKIDHVTGQIIWKLGGTNSDFTFPNDPNAFSGQHTARRLPSGYIGLFDNGNQHPLPRHSRVVEYELDTVNWTATMIYEHDAAQNVYAWATGSYQHDEPGHRCIGWGYTNRPEPSITHLDSNGAVISRFHFENNASTYRAYAYHLDTPLPRPAIDCENNGGTVTLTAPSGHSSYLWNTGETSQSIILPDTGTYMVWVDHGIGMMGSRPLFITDLSQACAYLSIGENPFKGEDGVVGYYDFTGRRLNHPEKGQVCVVVYESGRRELTIVEQ